MEKKSKLPGKSFPLSDWISSLLWVSSTEFLYSVWNESTLFYYSLSGEKFSIPCENYYTAMALDRACKLVYMAPPDTQVIDTFDLKSKQITENVFNLGIPLTKTLVTRLILKKENTLLGITKDPGYFLINLKKKSVVFNNPLPFKIISHDYNDENEILALGVNLNKNHSHVIVTAQSLMLEKEISKEMERKVRDQITYDENFSPKQSIRSIALSKACKYLVLGTKGIIYLYLLSKNSDTNELSSVFNAHSDPTPFNITSLRFSPFHESLLLSAGSDGIINFYNVERRAQSKKNISKKSEEKEIGFLELGWNTDGSWIYYTKGPDIAMQKSETNAILTNKLYLVCWDNILQKSQGEIVELMMGDL